MSIPYTPYPAPHKLKSVAQWLVAGLYTTYYGTQELTCLSAWYGIRHARILYRKYKHSDSKVFQRYEQYCIGHAEKYRHRWGHAFLRTFNVTCNIEHKHTSMCTDKPYIVAQLNQQSIIELAVAAVASSDRTHCIHCSTNQYGSLPTQPFIQPYYLVNIEFAFIPMFGWCRALCGVIIRRKNKQSTKAGVNRVIHRMQQFHDTFLLSVEGERSPTGTLAPYKKGAAILAILGQADIIPTYGVNAGNVWPYGEWQIRPGHVTMVYDQIISTTGMTIDDRTKLSEQLRNMAETEIPKLAAKVQIKSSL